MRTEAKTCFYCGRILRSVPDYRVGENNGQKIYVCRDRRICTMRRTGKLTQQTDRDRELPMRQVKIFESWSSAKQLEDQINQWLRSRPEVAPQDERYHFTVTLAPDPRAPDRLKYAVLVEYTTTRLEE
jgi:hypothetical protein